jgi:hypothetical protein
VVATTNTPAGFLGSSTKATTQRQVILDSKRYEATRTGSKAWSCVKHKTLDPATYDLTLGLTSASGAQTIGADNVNGTAVWHIAASENDPQNNTTGTADYYISQTDGTLVRQVVDATQSSNGLSLNVHLAADYSQYGEAVKVKLPTACSHPKSQPLAGRASTASLLNLLPAGAGTLL